jgi:hypothetical protein
MTTKTLLPFSKLNMTATDLATAAEDLDTILRMFDMHLGGSATSADTWTEEQTNDFACRVIHVRGKYQLN